MQGPEPFFSNNVEGFLKVLTMAGGIVAAIWTFMWRMLNSKQVQDINAVGTRVNTLHTEQTALLTQVTEIRRAQDKQEITVSALETENTELRTEFRNMKDHNERMRNDILNAFATHSKNIADQIHELDKTVALAVDRNHREG